ncbi:helix-turn-helix domain-containing protein [Aliidiomarina minuta]
MSAYGKKNGCKLTYHELAELTGLSKATLEAVGSRPDYNTTLATIDALCSYFNCDIQDLLEFTNESKEL